MSEVTVTKKQMDGIKLIKEEKNYELSEILKRNAEGFKWDFSSFYKPKEENVRNELNTMTAEQIVLAWHGFAKVEPEYVTFEEAMKALKDGKKVRFNNNGAWFSSENDFEDSDIGFYTEWSELFNGKWEIKE